MDKKIMLGIVLATVIIAVVAIESSKNKLAESGTIVDVQAKNDRTAFKEQFYKPAKELVSPNGYINTEYINISEHIGKNVILLDFWTYSCINCQRTMPYLNAWHEKYKDKGLAIIGIHTPEFEFEKDISNVRQAVEKYGVKHPVVLDNDFLTWRAYENRYWPRKYLIDIDGFIVYDHIGEGGYEETEKRIQTALEERNKVLKLNEVLDMSISNPDAESVDFGKIKTPELYLGYSFSRDQIGNPEGFRPEMTINYTAGKLRQANYFYLDGEWKNNADNMESIGKSRLFLKYSSKKANIVAGANQQADVKIIIDGVIQPPVTISGFDLYTVAEFPEYGEHELQIEAPPGVMIYTFTFG